MVASEQPGEVNGAWFYVPNNLVSAYRAEYPSPENKHIKAIPGTTPAKTSVASATITVANQTYTGKARTPNPVVKVGGKTLAKGTDYTVSYKNNTNVGTATVTITGKGNYTGTKSATFKITKASSSSSSSSSAASKFKRLKGSNALETMRKNVKEGWTSSRSVILATSGGYWDALSAAGLAGKLGCPVLLTNGQSLSSSARSEINRLGATTVYIVGGTGAVSARVASQVRALPKVSIVNRLAGANAQGTANAIAAEVGKSATGWGVVATSNGYWDALAASPYAYAKKAPVFLTNGRGLISDATVRAMKAAGVNKAVVAGGVGAVSSATETKLRRAGISVVRRAGSNAIATSASLATWALGQGLGANGMGIATVNGYWDALTGAALCGKRNAVLVLASNSNSSAVTQVVRANKASITRAYVFGGTAAVSAATYNQAVAAAS